MGKEPLCADDPTVVAVVGDPAPALKVPHFSRDDIQGLVDFIEKKLFQS